MASTYLSRTTSSLGSATTSTLSVWVKRNGLSAEQKILFWGTGSTNFNFEFKSDDKLVTNSYNGGSQDMLYKTTRVFRDTSAWYHLVLKIDTTQATGSDRIKLYVNGVQETVFDTSTIPAQNETLEINYFNNSQPYIGQNGSGSHFFDGSMSHFHWIDGTAYDASAFGETDATTGIWKPKTAPSVTYGTNGFFLKFENSGAFGTDSSGNANNFTVNGTMTQLIDTPSNVFATMNPLSAYGSVTLANGNTQVNVADNTDNATSTFMVSSGKYYWEGKYTVGAFGLAMVGIRPEGMNYNQINLFNLTGTYQGYYYYADSGNQRPANTAYGDTYDVGDIIGFALDLDSATQTITFYKNGVSQGAITIATSGLTWGFSFTGGDSDTFQMNFGNGYFGTTAVASAQNPDDGIGIFEYSVPTGYRALCTKSINAEEYS
jgi:hypothetical protein